jgi:hypothetical protein
MDTAYDETLLNSNTEHCFNEKEKEEELICCSDDEDLLNASIEIEENIST